MTATEKCRPLVIAENSLVFVSPSPVVTRVIATAQTCCKCTTQGGSKGRACVKILSVPIQLCPPTLQCCELFVTSHLFFIND